MMVDKERWSSLSLFRNEEFLKLVNSDLEEGRKLQKVGYSLQ